MEAPKIYFQRTICSYFLNCSDEIEEQFIKTISFIAINRIGLKRFGDISFDISKTVWERFASKFNINVNAQVFSNLENENVNSLNNFTKEFLQYASGWMYKVINVEIHERRCFLSLDRIEVVKLILYEVLKDPKGYGKIRSPLRKKMNVMSLRDNGGASLKDLSIYRVEIVKDMLTNILNSVEYKTSDDDIENEVINVCVKSVVQKDFYPIDIRLQVGVVLDPLTKRRTTLTTSEYELMRSNEMHLIALHKYGLRMSGDKAYNSLMSNLGKAAVKVDLLEIKSSSPINIIRNGQGCTKGASFILYNSARIETLLSKFEDGVKSGKFVNLPNIEQADFSLLKEEEEWQLIFSFIMEYPNVIEAILYQLEKGIASTHIIIKYLSSFASLFSCYYRRIRILTECRKQLIPYLHARIYLLKAVQIIFNKSLALLKVDPVTFM